MSKKSSILFLAALVSFHWTGVGSANEAPLPADYLVMDKDGNGEISEVEFVAYAVEQAKAEFRRLDADGSGVLRAGEVTGGAARTVRKGGSFLPLLEGNEEQSGSFRKRVSAGPSMRQGGR